MEWKDPKWSTSGSLLLISAKTLLQQMFLLSEQWELYGAGSTSLPPRQTRRGSNPDTFAYSLACCLLAQNNPFCFVAVAASPSSYVYLCALEDRKLPPMLISSPRSQLPQLHPKCASRFLTALHRNSFFPFLLKNNSS